MADTSALKRPKPGDNEEELIRLQEEFLRTQQEPSARLINLSDQAKNEGRLVPRNTFNAGKTESKFKKLKTQRARVSTSHGSGSVLNPKLHKQADDSLFEKTCDMVQNIPASPSSIILGNIVEKKYNIDSCEFIPANRLLPDTLETGFPKVFVSDSMKNEGKGSLFWQRIAKEKRDFNNTSDPENSKEKTALSNTEIVVEKNDSVLIEGTWAEEIHKENLAKLNQMTPEEILHEKSKLEATLSPDLIQFLKNRKNMKNKLKANDKNDSKLEGVKKNNIQMECEDVVKKTEKKVSELNNDENSQKFCIKSENDSRLRTDEINTCKPTSEPMQCDENTINLPEQPVELLKTAKEKGWVHMDSVEPEKLKWMEVIPVDKKVEPSPEEPYNARFDFNGVLLPFKDESLTVDKGLHHHGDEPERPGYSLQELLQLSRSSTQQQRCTALTTLANILEKSRKGWYDKALDPAPLIALSQRNILLLLRFSLDDTSVAVVTATLQALRAFLYNEADEVCLDRLYGWDNYKEPVLTPPPNDVDDISNLRDHELSQLDAVAVAIRADIVLRIRYILSEMRPTPVGVTCALEILIRLARHSHITALNIACTPHLLAIIVENFIPLCTDRLVVQDAVNNAYGTPMVPAIRLCRILVGYAGKPVADRLGNLKIIQSILSYISSDTGKAGIKLSIESLRLWKLLLRHQVAIDSIAGARLTLVSQLQLLLSNHDLGSASELACEYAAALIDVAACEISLKGNISTLLSKWSIQLSSVPSLTWGITKLVAQTLLIVPDRSALKTSWIMNPNIFSNLCSMSNLLSDCILATEREPNCLPSLGVLTLDGHLQPMVSQHSCIPFLATAINFFCEESLLPELHSIFAREDFRKYLYKLEENQWSLIRSWYTRMELYLIIAVVKAAHALGNELDNSTALTVWKIAIKLISSLPADNPSNVKKVLSIALDNDRLNLETTINSLAKLNLGAADADLKISAENNVTAIYGRYIEPNGSWNQAAMPQDWLYLPLVHIYSKCKNNVSYTQQDKETILTVLSLELVLPDLVTTLSPTLRFSRLVLVYLCETVYLNEDVSLVLSKTISVLLEKYYKRLDFTTELPGLNSFTDLFTAMCEHFCSTSYGDHNFGMVLLVPLAQRHDVHYRKLLWSEHAGALRYLRLPLEKLVIPLKEYYYPAEEDASLIESYLTALVRGTIRQEWCPVPYAIAAHHSALYLKRDTKLATRMRTQIEKIQNQELARALLSYEPPKL